jgi:hypothetical protein
VANLAGKFFARFPNRERILPVYAVIVFIVYGWTLIKFFYQLPAWLFFLTLDEITGILITIFLHGFLESLLVIGAFVMLSALLPSSWMKNNFVVTGSLSALLIYLSIGLYLHFTTEKDFLMYFPYWIIATLMLCAAIAMIVSRFDRAKRIVESTADRFLIFLFVQIPLTAIALIAFVIRNLA